MKSSLLLQQSEKLIPKHEARLLLAHVLGCEIGYLLTHPELQIDPNAFNALLQRRIAREPLQLIMGTTWFWDFELEVSTATLIPRPDSETLVEAALAACAGGAGRVLDLGTGTGCLLLAFLRERLGWFGVGVDVAPAAAALAARNAGRAAVAARAAFVAGDWAAAIGGGFDLVLSNPPYIPRAGIAALDAEVRDWEPASALDGGDDGLAAYRLILADLPRLLAPGGVAVLELGAGQAPDVTALSGALELAAIKRDLAGIERALILRRRR